MKVILIIFVLEIANGFTKGTEKLDDKNKTPKVFRQTCGSHFDILIKDLISQSWEDDRLCLDQILDTIDNAKNSTLWATWVWDSMQLPVGQLYGSRNHLGNYDQCLREKVGSSKPPYSMQFCLADILLQHSTVNISPETIDLYSSVDTYVKSMTVLEQRFNEMSWGLCVPRVCKAKSVERFARALLKPSYLGYLQSIDNVTVNCEHPQPGGVNGATNLFTFILLTTLTVAVCTVYASAKQRENPTTYVDTIKRCFCMKRNAKELMERPKNDLHILHGIRCISCAMIVLVHVIFIPYTITTANGLDFEEDLLNYGQYILHFAIVVDTFFFMSGLLFIRNIKKESTTRELIDALIKRYFRLIWWYIANVIIIFFVLPNSGCGPLCSKYVKPEKQKCYRTWWSGLLMIANYYDVFSVCSPASWYIFCDFQISVVAYIVFWIHQRHKRVGTTCFAVLVVLSIILPGYSAYFGEEFSVIPIKFDLYKTTRNSEIDAAIMHLYSKAHYRANPYLMGVMMGYIMCNYKPEAIRNFFTKKRVINGVLSFTVLTIILLVAFLNGTQSLSTALILSLHRPFWAVLLCAFIGVCEYGSFPVVKDMLSWKAFVPLSKLTYGIYMINFTTIAASSVTTRSALHFNVGTLIEKYLAHLTLAALISLYFMLFVESPLNNVVKVVLAKRGNTNLTTFDAIVKNGGNSEVQNGIKGIKLNNTTTHLSQSEFKLKEY